MWVGYAKKDWSLARGISHGDKFGNLIGPCDRVAADKSDNIWVGTYVIFPKTDWNQFPHSNLCSRVCWSIKWKKFEVGSIFMVPNQPIYIYIYIYIYGLVGYHENWSYLKFFSFYAPTHTGAQIRVGELVPICFWENNIRPYPYIVAFIGCNPVAGTYEVPEFVPVRNTPCQTSVFFSIAHSHAWCQY